MQLTLKDMEICLLGGPQADDSEHVVINRVVTDSRMVERGDVFVCLEGERFDGHGFAAKALQAGAVAVVSSKIMPELPGDRVIMVQDTQKALGQMAAYHRLRTTARVVAVTGSAGKTTVKELLAQSLSQTMRVARNKKNFNNQIGLPLSILAASGNEDAWVMELGISQPQDMDELGVICRPDIALVTNVGPAHLDGLGDVDGVAVYKTRLFKYMTGDGMGIACKDYPELEKAALAYSPDVLFFSTRDEDCPYYCAYLGAEEGKGRFEVRVPGYRTTLSLPFFGRHFAEDVAAVFAAAHLLQAELPAVAKALGSAELPDQRFHCAQCGPWMLIDDSYNANPLSMKSAVQTARDMAGENSLILVLGDMKELGEGAATEHEELGRAIAQAAPEAVFYQGEHCADVQRGMEGFTPGCGFNEVHSVDDLKSAWGTLQLTGGVVLVKGSRSCRMEQYCRVIGEGDRR